MSQILIVDDELSICQTLQLHLERQGHAVGFCHSAEDGLTIADRMRPEIVILDIRMPGMGGMAALPHFRRKLPDAYLIMVTAFHDMETTIQAMRQGATEYIHKPIDIPELEWALRKAESRLKADAVVTIEQSITRPSGDSGIIGGSRIMRDVYKTIGLVSRNSPISCPVLIQGESGTGKELVARVIHHASDNRDKPFVAINCAALVDTLLESEMFGHEKGAFTGAHIQKDGKLTLAGEGTLLLDELGELTPSIQAKLLRVLQERSFERLGGNQTLATRCRIIAATNKDLRQAVMDGEFRDDLFYRLSVITIPLPPLRERREDIPELVHYLLSKIIRETGRRVTTVSQELMDMLVTAPWPGNVRQLENTLMKAVVLSQGSTLCHETLSEEILTPGDFNGMAEDTKAVANGYANADSLKSHERWHILKVLERTGWHKGKSCEALGISRPRLDRKIKQYNLVKPG